MTTARPQRAGLLALPSKVNLLLAAVRFEESMFALPIGYIGMLLAADGWPTWQQFLWINVGHDGGTDPGYVGQPADSPSRKTSPTPALGAGTCLKAGSPLGTCGS